VIASTYIYNSILINTKPITKATFITISPNNNNLHHQIIGREDDKNYPFHPRETNTAKTSSNGNLVCAPCLLFSIARKNIKSNISTKYIYIYIYIYIFISLVLRERERERDNFCYGMLFSHSNSSCIAVKPVSNK